MTKGLLVVRKYVVCGPFPYRNLLWDGEESFYVDYLSSIGGEERAELRPGMKVDGRSCIEVETTEDGFVNLVKLYGEDFKDFWRLEYGVAYAYTELVVDEEGTYVALLGSEDYAMLYVNGELVFVTHVARRYEDSFYAIPVKLVKGVNRVLLKIARLAGGWGFSLKLVKPDTPVYVNTRRTIAPKPRAGSRVYEWIGLHVLALEDTDLTVECVENDTWYPCSSGTYMLKAGERVQIPIYIVSKKPLTENSEIELVLKTRAGEKRLKVPIEISRSNHVVHTYRSSYDGSVHRYGVKLPTNFNEHEEYPAVFILHGFKGIQMYSEIFGDKDWIYAVGITARDGEVNYREIGLLEVLEVIEDLSRRYPVDRERLYLMGHSMGGYGTWYIGVKYPHVFAVLAPHSGRGDLSHVVEKLSRIPGWSGVAQLVNLYNPALFLENVLSTPIYIAHGSEDNIVPVQSSRDMARKLAELGVEHIYEEIPGKKHWWGSYTPGSYYGAEAIDRPSLEEFLKPRRRRVPRRVVALVDSIRFSKVWWVRLRELTYENLARIDIEAVPGENALILHSISNAVEFSVDVNMLSGNGLIYTNRDLTIKYKNRYLIVPRTLLGEELVIRVYDNATCTVHGDVELCSNGEKMYSRVHEKAIRLPNKNILPGPFMDIFNGRVFIVPCTDSTYVALCRKIALWLQSWFIDYANGISRVVSYNEVVSSGLDGKANVVAIGGPEVNKYVSEVVDEIKPVKIESYMIRVKDKVFSGENYGLALVYPNPRAGYRRYLGILGSNSETGIKHLYRLELTIIPDYIVYDAENLGIRFKGVVDSGFFNVYWE